MGTHEPHLHCGNLLHDQRCALLGLHGRPARVVLKLPRELCVQGICIEEATIYMGPS